ncbi:Variant surface glycoprotein [Trypanosoma congolense IL3000]|uniref:Variant surface glycoprotein n=1 Tax=Trypanosoma congolense (strain IL3000) TaxID=1068625 RepID=F9W3I0_TRYCI|nr:Variant surface glycoprotein [Trypanosoma congolense IL3000]
MWGNVMIFFVFFRYLVEAVHCHNELEQELLCDIFRQSERVLQKFEDDEPLKQAIYGPTDNNAQIIKFGNVTLGTSCHGPVLRDQFCRYHGSKRGKDGCFAESLLGTFFCICAPGARRGYVDNLCGVGIRRHVDSWYGYTPQREDEIEEIFGNVWKDIISNCTGGSESVESGNEELEKLRKAVEEVENTIKPDRNGFFYNLGWSGGKDCSGSDTKDVCAAYQKKDGSGSKAHIPWMEKIKETVTQLQKMERERQYLDTRKRTTGKNSESMTTLTHHAEGYAELTVQSEGTVTPPSSDRTPSKTKISTETSPITNIPHLATDLNEDGTPLTNQKWLVVAALLN